MWGACTQSHEWARLCDKLSVSWLLIIPYCLFPNTVLAVKHLIYCKKELVFDPTCRTSAGNRFLTPSRIFLLSVVQQKPTNPILAGFGWRGTGETISNLQIEHVHEQWWGKVATRKTWKTGQRKKTSFLHYKHSDYSNHQEMLPMVMTAHLTRGSLCGGRGWRWWSSVLSSHMKLVCLWLWQIKPGHRIGWSLR